MGVCHTPPPKFSRAATFPNICDKKYRCTLKLALLADGMLVEDSIGWNPSSDFSFSSNCARRANVKLLKAAGLTLVGWCLIMPPLSDDRQQVKEKAPLSHWDTITKYDSAAACKKELAKLAAVISGNINLSVIQRRALAGKCVAADDPRLHSENFEVY
jgi:hypothetical protein